MARTITEYCSNTGRHLMVYVGADGAVHVTTSFTKNTGGEEDVDRPMSAIMDAAVLTPAQRTTFLQAANLIQLWLRTQANLDPP